MFARGRLLLLPLWGLSACSKPGEVEVQCLRETTQAIVGGTSTPLLLTDSQGDSIGAVEDVFNTVLCTGTLVASGWALTAGHCNAPSGLRFRVQTADGRSVRVAVPRQFVHPTEDIALLQLSPSEAFAELDLEPFVRSQESIGISSVGTEAVMAGFGENQNGERGTRVYLQTEISDVNDSEITTDGQGDKGACSGDSGGPLLVTTEDETVVLVGTLSRGSNSCTDLDIFLQIAPFADWIETTIAEVNQDPCGPITHEGTCDSDRALWCAGDILEVEDCQNHNVCGWNSDAGGYRCMRLQEDPCEGAGPSGFCANNQRKACVLGELIVENCSRCDQTCVINQDDIAECKSLHLPPPRAAAAL